MITKVTGESDEADDSGQIPGRFRVLEDYISLSSAVRPRSRTPSGLETTRCHHDMMGVYVISVTYQSMT